MTQKKGSVFMSRIVVNRQANKNCMSWKNLHYVDVLINKNVPYHQRVPLIQVSLKLNTIFQGEIRDILVTILESKRININYTIPNRNDVKYLWIRSMNKDALTSEPVYYRVGNRDTQCHFSFDNISH